MRLARIAVLAACLVSVWAAPATAQEPPGPIVGGSVAAAVANSDTHVSFSGFAGYRFNRVFGFALELTYLPTISPAQRDRYLPISIINFEQSLLLATNDIRLEVPTTTRRVTPFVAAGVGIASIQTDYRLGSGYPIPVDALEALGVPTSLITFPDVVPYSNTSTGLAMTIGGGVAISVSPRLSIDVDLREIHVRGSDGGDLGRFGVGASYRF